MEKTLIRAVSDQPGRIDPCAADLDRRRINHPLLAFLAALFERPAADLDPLTEALPQAPFDLGRLGQLANLLDRTFHRVPAEDLRLYPEQASEKELKQSQRAKPGPLQTRVTLLDEHFRSPPPIIEFSKREFYGGRLKVMQERPGRAFGGCLEYRYVSGPWGSIWSVTPVSTPGLLSSNGTVCSTAPACVCCP
ncbi:MAG: hypothetical protein AAF657_40025 [Acidobacteriota bacterium]